MQLETEIAQLKEDLALAGKGRKPGDAGAQLACTVHACSLMRSDSSGIQVRLHATTTRSAHAYRTPRPNHCTALHCAHSLPSGAYDGAVRGVPPRV